MKKHFLLLVSAPLFAFAPFAMSEPAPMATPTASPAPSSSPAPSPSPTASPTPVPTPRPLQTIELEVPITVYVREGQLLVPRVRIPAGSVLAVPVDYSLTNLNYLDAHKIETRSSTGFIYPAQVLTIPGQEPAPEIVAVLDELRGASRVLYVPGEIVGALQGVSGQFEPIQAQQAPGAGYLAHFYPHGQAVLGYTKRLERRFGANLNQAVPSASLDSSSRAKWRKIFAELVHIADRTHESPRSLQLMERSAARRWSESFERNGAIAQNGMWSIAMQTASRNGFGDTPCAEFMSEILRQAYQRAGYRVADDFTEAKGNQLHWRRTAAVVHFSRALFLAGWVPWTANRFRPPTGAFLFAEAGKTPGHTYIAANEGARVIVDNGSPQGRDLGSASHEVIEKMYHTGLFFLPPGIQPEEYPPLPKPTPSPSPSPTPLPLPTPAPSPKP